MVFKTKPGVPTYQAMHFRLKRRLGKASNYRCITCGAPAQEWSCFRNKVLTDSVTTPGKILAYSQSIDDYAPLCKRCHRYYDAARGEERSDAVLTDEIVLDLRSRAASEPVNRAAEALRLGVRTPAISRAISGERWKHLPTTPSLASNGRVVLTDEIVLDLRERHRIAPLNGHEEARRLGVHQTTVWAVLSGKSWKHLL